MPQIDVFFTPGNDATVLDSAALLERLRAMIGEESALGWRTAASANIDGRWLVTLEHDGADISPVRSAIESAGDSRLQLFADAPERRMKVQALGIEALSLPLPDRVPPVLAGSEAAQRKSAAFRGILMGIVVSALLAFMTPRGGAVRHMFDPSSPTGTVPISILCLFFWGVLYGMNRRKRLQAIEELNSPELLPALIHGLHMQGVTRLEEALRGEEEYSIVRYSPLLRRVWMTLEQWLIRPSLQNAHLVIEQQVMADREATQRAFNLLRMFVWATPVLGLIGTVVGISIAVGGFAGFLSTSVDDVSKIKAGLVGVTGGLSFAFLITLEGLLSSLILMLFTSNIQTREERLYAGIERDVAEKFLPELQRMAPERDLGGVVAGPDAWAVALADASKRVMRTIEVTGRRVLAKWDERQEVVKVLSDLDSTLRELKPLLARLAEEETKK
jgi:biopolymer transport protein ExbB/TolQ